MNHRILINHTRRTQSRAKIVINQEDSDQSNAAAESPHFGLTLSVELRKNPQFRNCFARIMF